MWRGRAGSLREDDAGTPRNSCGWLSRSEVEDCHVQAEGGLEANQQLIQPSSRS